MTKVNKAPRLGELQCQSYPDNSVKSNLITACLIERQIIALLASYKSYIKNKKRTHIDLLETLCLRNGLKF